MYNFNDFVIRQLTLYIVLNRKLYVQWVCCSFVCMCGTMAIWYHIEIERGQKEKELLWTDILEHDGVEVRDYFKWLSPTTDNIHGHTNIHIYSATVYYSAAFESGLILSSSLSCVCQNWKANRPLSKLMVSNVLLLLLLLFYSACMYDFMYDPWLYSPFLFFILNIAAVSLSL